ncbi:MAG: hypothetical protein ABUS57_06230 [Pseudomonadota bacterium]
MNTVRWVLSGAIYFAMVALCVFRFDLAGIGGLAGSALGFVFRVWTPGQDTVGERLGNGYVGLLMGICVGFVAGAIVQHFFPQLTHPL